MCPRNTIRNAVLHQEFFEHTRLVVAAIEDGVILIFGLVDKVMSNQFTGYTLCFMFLIIRRQNLKLSTVAQFRKRRFSNT
jgi:hypothetical protein